MTERGVCSLCRAGGHVPKPSRYETAKPAERIRWELIGGKTIRACAVRHRYKSSRELQGEPTRLSGVRDAVFHELGQSFERAALGDSPLGKDQAERESDKTHREK